MRPIVATLFGRNLAHRDELVLVIAVGGDKATVVHEGGAMESVASSGSR
jgi:hypothetical protein